MKVRKFFVETRTITTVTNAVLTAIARKTWF